MWRLLAAIFLIGCSSSSTVPSDEELQRRFTSHRARFEAVRDALLAEPSLDEVRGDALTWSEPCEYGTCRRWVDGRPTTEALARAQKTSVERARDYLAALKDLRIERMTHDGKRSVELTVGSWGIVPSGGHKSIVWSAQPPRPMYGAEDERRTHGAHGSRVRPLGDGWYLVSEWN